MPAIRFLSAILIVLVMPLGAWAEESSASSATAAAKDPVIKQPREIVDDTVAKVFSILRDPVYKDPAKKLAMREKTRSILLRVVDMNAICALTLANYRKKFSEEQFAKFSDTFSRLLFSTYITHLEKYSNEKVVILETKNLSDSRVQVRTKTVTDTKEMPVDFSFNKQNERWLLYDVNVEGVSLVVNYRSQFREVLLNQTPEQLLQRLEQKVEENEKGP